MIICHNSRNIKYRKPFGAVPVGTAIELFIEISGVSPESVRLMMWHDDAVNPTFLNMKPAGDSMYGVEIRAPEKGGLIWYAFSIQVGDDDDRRILYYGNNDQRTGGEGRLYYDHEVTGSSPAPFQITVYRESGVPSWYKDGIIYQIFPDRFARDDDWRARCEASAQSVNSRPEGEKRIVQENWNTPAYYIRDDRNRVTGWPIYGGSLRGIRDKLDYLRSLGVTGIYLNPVFESTSNHHYDTADYMKIDPALGTEADFAELADEARKRGIRLILDGVFSHTGADSKYFDRYGNFGRSGVRGAYGHEDSPYRSWFKFDENEEYGYKTWWGVEDLPEVDENDPGFRELILGEEGVIAHWMSKGASGWRLDVADELPDSFIQEARERIRNTDPDGLLIGEVWEDASNKISYGERRRYFMGDELDGVMNYPLRTVLLDYINYTITSGQAGDRLMSLKENYPSENFYAGLNLIGSHDRERIITAMAAEEDYPSAVRKVRVMSTLQFTLPGVPCIYYGDEVGLTGGVDPLNRNGYPWGFENLDLGYHYRMLGLIYDEHPVLKGGDFTMLSGRYGISDDVFAFMRSSDTAGERIIVLANRSYGPVDVDLRDCAEAGGAYALELLTSKEVEVNGKGLSGIIHMDRLSAKVIMITDRAPAGQKLDKGAGVICHISSLGKGVLGSPAKEFADYLASAGMKYWQVLPLNPPGLGMSPYSSYAAFAGNPAFINREELPDSSGYAEFCRDNMDWLCEYAAYTIIRKMQDDRPWYKWPEEYRDGDPSELLEKLSADHGEEIDRLVKDQYYFHAQWKDLKEYANRLGIRIMGDLPMFMSDDSVDVWANKSIFRLDENGRLSVHAGVPPDAFSKEGQDWGNPLYDWDALKADGYGWWIRRMKQCAERYDVLRIDHFRGLSEYFAIPQSGKPADGYWQHSAGLGFFRAICGMITDQGYGLKLLAEDLGFLDDGVKNLLTLSGLPGMDIWQFTAAEMMEMTPEEASARAFYTGTHDNDTLMGFIREKVIPEMPEEDKPSDPDELGAMAENEALRIIRKIYESPAAVAMIQLQDMFMLGSNARMNVPGIAKGNWTWKIPGDSIEKAFDGARERAEWFRELAAKTGRL